MHLILCGWSSAQLHEQRGLGSKGASPLVSLADLSVDWAERFFALIPLRHVLSKQICRREWRGPHVRRAQGHLAAEQCWQALESEPLDAAKTRGLMGRSHGTPGRGKSPMWRRPWTDVENYKFKTLLTARVSVCLQLYNRVKLARARASGELASRSTYK